MFLSLRNAVLTIKYFCIKRAIRYKAICTLQVHVSRRCASYLSREGSSQDFARFGRVPSFPFPTSDIFPAAVLAGRMERHFPDAGAWNEFNSTALRNWLRSHSSDKFLIVCPAPSGEFARFRHPRGWSPLSYSGLTTSIYVQDTTGVSRVFRVVSRTRVPLAR